MGAKGRWCCCGSASDRSALDLGPGLPRAFGGGAGAQHDIRIGVIGLHRCEPERTACKNRRLRNWTVGALRHRQQLGRDLLGEFGCGKPATACTACLDRDADQVGQQQLGTRELSEAALLEMVTSGETALANRRSLTG